MTDLGPLVAAGRDAEIFAAGPGRVLRRARSGRSLAVEAAVMDHARAHRFPVPAVHELVDGAIVMDRIDGAVMLDDLVRRPWRLRRHARTLADLHRQLRSVPAPDGPNSRLGSGNHLVHGDLHPANVLLASDGPVVIDWSNAGAGPAMADVAMTWVITATSEVDGSRAVRMAAAGIRRLFLRTFLAAADGHAARALLATAAKVRLADANLRPGERNAIERLLRG